VSRSSWEGSCSACSCRPRGGASAADYARASAVADASNGETPNKSARAASARMTATVPNSPMSHAAPPPRRASCLEPRDGIRLFTRTRCAAFYAATAESTITPQPSRVLAVAPSDEQVVRESRCGDEAVLDQPRDAFGAEQCLASMLTCAGSPDTRRRPWYCARTRSRWRRPEP
jgi:hypothetical protein